MLALLLVLPIFYSVFMAVRDICADWLKGMEPRDDPILQGKKDVETGFRVELAKRNIPPSNTQVGVLYFGKEVVAHEWVAHQGVW